MPNKNVVVHSNANEDFKGRSYSVTRTSHSGNLRSIPRLGKT